MKVAVGNRLVSKELLHPFVADWDECIDARELDVHAQRTLIGERTGKRFEFVYLTNAACFNGDKTQLRKVIVKGPMRKQIGRCCDGVRTIKRRITSSNFVWIIVVLSVGRGL